MELNITKKPILASLLPEDVNHFLTQWNVYEGNLREVMGIQKPLIQPCIKITLITELKAVGTDVNDRASILETFADLRNQDHEARKHLLVEKLRMMLSRLTGGTFPLA